MPIHTAIIPVAGAGTRMLPETSAIEKCLMPVYADDNVRPLVDYMVDDCVRAGVKRIIFVTSARGKQQLSDYFSREIPGYLYAQLEHLGKQDMIDAEINRRSASDLIIEYIIQPPNLYGTAVPPYLAKDMLAGEKQFAVMGGDDFVYHPDGTSELARAMAAWERDGTDHYVTAVPVDRAEASKFGILRTDSDGKLLEIDEKPPLERVPDNPKANISRYLFSEAIWPLIEAEIATDRIGEHYITYPVSAAIIAGQTFGVHTVTGKYLDGGNPASIRAAGNWITDHPPIG